MSVPVQLVIHPDPELITQFWHFGMEQALQSKNETLATNNFIGFKSKQPAKLW